jgi:transcriptional regulator
VSKVEAQKVEALMSSARFPIPQGTLDMLILHVLSLQPAHGYAIAQRVQQISRDTVHLNQGSLYPALHRLEQKDWIEAEWGTSANNRRAKFYRLSAAGRRQLKAEERAWRRFAKGVELVLALG